MTRPTAAEVEHKDIAPSSAERRGQRHLPMVSERMAVAVGAREEHHRSTGSRGSARDPKELKLKPIRGTQIVRFDPI